jgi:hypothetical protein
MHNMSLEEMQQNLAGDGTFNTGAKWSGVWTRDISYSIILGIGMLHPEVSMNSLMRKVSRKRIIQDTGTGGSWPVSSDRVVWSMAAWELYLITGDESWLKETYEIIKNTIEDDLLTVYSEETGLFYGESSFLDWREQTYPRWMEPKDIYMSQNLGTNAAFYQTIVILTKMAERLGEDASKYEALASELKDAINQYFWLEEEGYYGQFLYGRNYWTLSPRAEALGEAFCVLFDIASPEQQKRIVENTPVVNYGTPCIFPQIPNIPPYHNNGIWPFVQAFWTMAAAKAENETAVSHSIASIYRQAAMFLTNKENMVAQNGDFSDTQINSDRQLWSVAGNLGTFYKVYFGMDMQADKLCFKPYVPEAYAGVMELTDFPYRDAKLNITLEGFGTEIAGFMLDGKAMEEHCIPDTLKGEHSLKIVLNNKVKYAGTINEVENAFSLPAPSVVLHNEKISWKEVEGAVSYHVFRNGEKAAEISDLEYTITKDKGVVEYQVLAIDKAGVGSFLSEPIEILPAEAIVMSAVSTPSVTIAGSSKGVGFVELTQKKHTYLTYNVEVAEAGAYFVDLVYANGNGSINTENKCAIRSLSINEEYAGVLVMPQRGTSNWDEWGISNRVLVNLKKGKNKLDISFEEHNINMNIKENKALLSEIRVYKK